MHRHVQDVMGTVVSYAVPDSHPDAAEAIAQACEWLDFVDATFSTYKPDSDVSRIRDGILSVEEAHPLVAEVLQIGHAAEAAGDGAFTLQPYGTFDPSGVVKGWALERASDILLKTGCPDHLINGGGDVQARGEREAGQPWRVAIADPRDRTRSAAVVGGIDPLAVATSGISERGEHIDRDALSDLMSLTVVGTSLTSVDIAATTAFGLGDEARAWIESRHDLAAFAILDGGRMWTSERMSQFLLG